VSGPSRCSAVVLLSESCQVRRSYLEMPTPLLRTVLDPVAKISPSECRNWRYPFVIRTVTGGNGRRDRQHDASPARFTRLSHGGCMIGVASHRALPNLTGCPWPAPGHRAPASSDAQRSRNRATQITDHGIHALTHRRNDDS
jgi:hypothetical protein